MQDSGIFCQLKMKPQLLSFVYLVIVLLYLGFPFFTIVLGLCLTEY